MNWLIYYVSISLIIFLIFEPLISLTDIKDKNIHNTIFFASIFWLATIILMWVLASNKKKEGADND